MKLFTLKNSVFFIFIFSMVNDTFVSELPEGNSVLLLIYLVSFIICLPKIAINYKKLLKAPLLLLFLLMCSVSLIVNFNNLIDISLNIRLLLAVFLVYNVCLLLNTKAILIFYLISVLFSIYLQLFVNEPLSEYTFRLSGGTGDPNEMATQVLISICLFPLLFDFIKIKFKLLLTIVFYGITMFSLLKAGSTTAGGVLVIIIIIMILRYFIINKISRKYLVISLALLSSIILINNDIGMDLSSFNAISDYIDRSQDNKGGFDSRYNTWLAGFDMFINNPFFGVGPGEFINNSKDYESGIIDDGAKAAHNVFVMAFGELGFFGGAILVIVFIVLIFSFLKNFKTINKTLFYVGLTVIVLFLMGMSLSLLFDKYFWFFIVFFFKVRIIRDKTKTIRYTSKTLYG